MKRSVVVTDAASRQIRAVGDWWRENRPAAPELFADELTAALDAISTHPGLGRRYPHPRVSGVRRALLRKSRYHVYFVDTGEMRYVTRVNHDV